MKPNRQKKFVAIAPAPAENVRFEKIRTSSRGPSRPSSKRVNAIPTTVAATNRLIVAGESHPQEGPWIIASTRAVTATVPNSSPAMSSRTALRAPRLGHHEGDRHDAHETEWDVDQEDRSVPEVRDQRATSDRSECDGDARGRSPDAECLGPLVRVIEDDRQGRERRGEDERGRTTHQGTRGQQRLDVVRERGEK